MGDTELLLEVKQLIAPFDKMWLRTVNIVERKRERESDASQLNWGRSDRAACCVFAGESEGCSEKKTVCKRQTESRKVT